MKNALTALKAVCAKRVVEGDGDPAYDVLDPYWRFTVTFKDPVEGRTVTTTVALKPVKVGKRSPAIKRAAISRAVAKYYRIIGYTDSSQIAAKVAGIAADSRTKVIEAK